MHPNRSTSAYRGPTSNRLDHTSHQSTCNPVPVNHDVARSNQRAETHLNRVDMSWHRHPSHHNDDQQPSSQQWSRDDDRNFSKTSYPPSTLSHTQRRNVETVPSNYPSSSAYRRSYTHPYPDLTPVTSTYSRLDSVSASTSYRSSRWHLEPTPLLQSRPGQQLAHPAVPSGLASNVERQPAHPPLARPGATDSGRYSQTPARPYFVVPLAKSKSRAHSPGRQDRAGSFQEQYPGRVSYSSAPYSHHHRDTVPQDSLIFQHKRSRLDDHTVPIDHPFVYRNPPQVDSGSMRRRSNSPSSWTQPWGRSDQRINPNPPRHEPAVATAPIDPSYKRAAIDVDEFETASLGSPKIDPLPTNDQGTKVKRRKRAILSCTECKQRKIKCDRNVPNCGSCVRRGVVHICRWGDERDNLPTSLASTITSSNAALMARIAQLESQLRSFQASISSTSQGSPSASNVAMSSTSHAKRSATDIYASATQAESVAARDRTDSRSGSFPSPSMRTTRDELSPKPPGPAGRPRFAHSDVLSEWPPNQLPGGELSEESDSVESGAEDASKVPEALAKGNQLQSHSSLEPKDRTKKLEPTDVRVSDMSSNRFVSGHQSETILTAASSSSQHRTELDDRQEKGQALNNPEGDCLNHDPSAVKSVEEMLDSVLPFPSVGSTDDDLQPSLENFKILVSLLPTKENVAKLIRNYIQEAEPLAMSIHRPSLENELADFWESLDQIDQKPIGNVSNPRQSLPDMQFAAFLFALVEGACEYMTPSEIMDSGICSTRSGINARLTLLVRCSTALLGMGNFIRSPTISGLQAIVTLRHFCFNRDHRDEYIVMYQMALRACQFIGIHRLESALDDEKRWAEENEFGLEPQRRSIDDGDGSEALTFNTQHRWKILTSTRISDLVASDSEGEDLDLEAQDLNAMRLPRGQQRRRWELKATKHYKDGNRVERELGRKVWFALATLDWLCAAFFDQCYYCKDEMYIHILFSSPMTGYFCSRFTTQSPQNLDDEDLVEESGNQDFDDDNDRYRSHGDSAKKPVIPFLDKIKPWSVPTSNSFFPIHVEICHTVRSIADAMNNGDESLDTVLGIEDRLRGILQTLPKFFRLDGESEYDPAIRQMHWQRPYLSLQRVVIHEYVHHRLLRLHRPFMGRGYRNPKYAHSTRTCIESARALLTCLWCLDQVQCRGQGYWIFKSHIFHAVLALQVDLLYLAHLPVDDRISAKRSDVVTGLQMLHARTDVGGCNSLLASSLKVIKLLCQEERARRSAVDEDSEGHASEYDSTSIGSATEKRAPANPHTEKFTPRGPWTAASINTEKLAMQLEKSILETWPSFTEKRGHTGKSLSCNTRQAQGISDPYQLRSRRQQENDQPALSESKSGSASTSASATMQVSPKSKQLQQNRPVDPRQLKQNPDSKPFHARKQDRSGKNVDGSPSSNRVSEETGASFKSKNKKQKETRNDQDPPAPIESDVLLERGDTELDEYLELLSSYQNPHGVPGGSNVFDVLDNLIFEPNSSRFNHLGEPTTCLYGSSKDR